MSMFLIRRLTVESGGILTLEFNNIPQIYDDLLMVVSLRSLPNRTDGWNDAQLGVNGSTASVSVKNLYGKGNGEVGSNTGASITAGVASPTNTTANAFSTGKFYIAKYKSSINKPYTLESFSSNNSNNTLGTLTGAIISDTNPITSLSINNYFNQNFQQYSSATLYGITAGSDGVTTVA